ncbi:hypothetical protein MPSEU_000480900 [Mayamaea pseudoterrestris]|nr:hypothetical protein MPSEU_000480900 [Mayamaea pseudoterrestris]
MSDLISEAIESYNVVEEEACNNVEVVPFGVHVSSVSDMLAFERPSSLKATLTSNLYLEKGIVGTILVMNNKSVLVWFGWGQLDHEASGTKARRPTAIGTATNLGMRPLMIGMPRTKYQGAFSGESEGPVSKLIGSENDEEETLARNLSARLSMKLGVPVMVSCSFEGCPLSLEGDVEAGTIQHRAAAQAERKIFKILQTKLKI